MARKKRPPYEGFQENVRELKFPCIDVWENKYRDKNYTIHLEIPEFTCICPKTRQPDFATIYIQYRPDKYCVELKSFKEYIRFFRDIGIFHEHATNRILEDFVASCQPRWAYIRAEFNIRGGIRTTVTAEYKGPARLRKQ
jgi:7-cyano-7-deazaguanine reductase